MLKDKSWKDNTFNLGILGAFVFIVIALVLIQAIGDITYSATTPFRRGNESIDISPARLVNADINETYPFTLTDNWTSGSLVVTNQTEGTLTLNTDYYLDTTNFYIYFNNTQNVYSNVSNTTHATYNFLQDTYVRSSIARTFINLILIFVVIGFFGGMLYYLWRRGWFGFLGI